MSAAPGPLIRSRGPFPATANIFQKLDLDFGILGENEVCCGSTAMRLGDAAEFKRVATNNLETFQKLHEEAGRQHHRDILCRLLPRH
jgi:Fe-S oxidoreductase